MVKFDFRVLKNSPKSRARLGLLRTPHGEVGTPALVPVATGAAVKTLTSEQARQAGCQILIANTFHLHLRPGEKIVKSAGGIHKFMNWKDPIMTDSGGFQVFSLGFGRDAGNGSLTSIGWGNQPRDIKITDRGVYFRSPLGGKKLFLGPRESIRIQEAIGADIIFAFDECTSPLAKRAYIEESLERTHKWAKICAKQHKTRQALFGIVQGSHFKDLRETSARFINSLNFDGFGIGGDLGKSKQEMLEIIGWVIPLLDTTKPRHLLGIGHLEDIEPIIKRGVDLFDCTAPTHYARRGIAFTSEGKINLNQSKFLTGKNLLDSRCGCFVCQNYSRAYLCHLVRAKEINAMSLLTFHNLFFFNSYVAGVRKKIKRGIF